MGLLTAAVRSRTRARAALAAALTTALATIAGGAAWWLHQQHPPRQAIAAAQAFVHDMEQHDHASAFARTLGGPATGTTPLELAATARRRLCPPAAVVYTIPFQSHGNRLRRWVAGRELDEPQVRVEFAGACLFGVTLRRVGPGQWRVSGFDSHAG